MKTDWKGQFCSVNSEKYPAVLSRHEVVGRCWFVGRMITIGVYVIAVITYLASSENVSFGLFL